MSYPMHFDFKIYSLRYQYQEINYWRVSSATHACGACRTSTMIFCLAYHTLLLLQDHVRKQLERGEIANIQFSESLNTILSGK